MRLALNAAGRIQGDNVNLKEQLIKHEGVRLRPYRCTAGKLTIGIGRNLDDVGISQEEALYLLDNDISKATSALLQALPWVKDLDDARRNVLINMAFNLGINGLLGFKNTLGLIEQGNYGAAAKQMLLSKWAMQVKDRAVELSKIMESGVI